MGSRETVTHYQMDELQETTMSRTYRLTPQLIRQLNGKAQELRVYPSDLVRFLLAKGLDEIESGILVVPTKPAYWNVVFEEDEDG